MITGTIVGIFAILGVLILISIGVFVVTVYRLLSYIIHELGRYH